MKAVSMKRNSQWYKVIFRPMSYLSFSIDEFAGLVADFMNTSVVQMEKWVECYIDLENLPSVENAREMLFNMGMEVLTEITPFDDRLWEEEWKKYVNALKIGRRLFVRPSWIKNDENPDPRVEIVIDPGMAFGTGQHETTYLCLEWLDTFVDREDVRRLSLLDVGTGSGILAIASAKLGFYKIAAMDTDAGAVTVALDNIKRNGVEDKVLLFAGGISAVKEKFDIVISNIQADVLKENSREFVEHVSYSNPRGGLIVLSGILQEQISDIVSTYEKVGFRIEDISHRGEWCLLVFCRSTCR